MKKIYLSLLGLLFCAFAFAQKAQISGKVFDANTAAPIANANIRVDGKAVAKADENGLFVVELELPADLSINHVGYQTYKQSLTTANTALNIGLVAVAKSLNEVEITATSVKDKSLLSQPASIAKLQDRELKRGNGLFLDDAINGNVPGVTMQRRTTAAGQQFNIRGYGNGARGTNGVNSNFDGQGYKVYLNGIPVTDAEGITLMDDIDFNSISNVEITKGPAGTLYGLAIAGAVNLQTRKANKGETSVGQNVLFGSNGLRRYTTHFETGTENSSIMVNYGKQKYDGFMPHTSSDKDFVNVIGDFKLGEKQAISSYFGYTDSYDERNGELTIEQYQNKDYTGNKKYIKNDAHSNVISFRAGLGHTYIFNKNISNTTAVYASGMSSNVSSAGGWTDKTPINFGLRSTFDTHFDLDENLSLSGITGVETQKQYAQTIGYAMIENPADPIGYNIIGTTNANQATQTGTTSLFTEWTLALPYGFSATAGVGLSNMNINLKDRLYAAGKPTSYNRTYDNLYSPHFAINKVFNKEVSVYASYSKGYKAPVSAYFFIPYAPTAPNETGIVNTGLKPEIGNQYEIGTKGDLLDGKLNYQLAGFIAVFSDKMTAVSVQDATNTTTLYSYMVNGGKQNNKGIEALVKYSALQNPDGIITGIYPFANATYSYFRYRNFIFRGVDNNKKALNIDYSGNAVANVAPYMANVGIDFTAKYGIYGNINYLYKDAMPFTSDGLNKADSYRILNAKIGVNQKIANLLNVDAYFGATNITEEQYPQMVFSNQLPDAYLPAPYKVNYFGGVNVKYIF